MLKELLLNLLAEHKAEILEWMLGGLAAAYALGLAKLPDPRKYHGRWFYHLYDLAFAFLSRASLTRWDEKGGAVKLPGTQYPRLRDVPDPRYEDVHNWFPERPTPRVPPGSDLTEVLHREDIEK